MNKLAGRDMGSDTPKLPFRQTSNKWSKLVVSLARQWTGQPFTAPSFNFVREDVLLNGGIELGLQKGEKKVEEVYGMCVWTRRLVLQEWKGVHRTYNRLFREES